MKYYSDFFIHLLLANLIDDNINSVNFNTINFKDDILCKKIIKISSSHLIIPLIYNILSKKKLLKLFPLDFISFIEHIHSINKQRNLLLYKQIKKISKSFNDNKINYVFLKGSALLCYNKLYTLDTRMIGDIDVLVDNKQIKKSYEILIREGYREYKDPELKFSEKFSQNEKRHLNRLVSKEYISAVEIHKSILDPKYEKISTDLILHNKVISKFNINIPSKEHLFLISILNWQYNSEGLHYNFIDFRTYNDVVNLNKKVSNEWLSNQLYEIKHFYSLISLFNHKLKSQFFASKYLYKLILHSVFFKKIYFRIVFLKINFLKFLKRFILFIRSKGYRREIFKNPLKFIKKIFKKIFNN